MKKRTLFFLLILFSILIIPGAVLAQEGGSATSTISAYETANEITIIEGNLQVEEYATVTGDITIIRGNAFIAGQVDGDIVLLSGNLEIADTAVINGENCVVLDGVIIGSGAASLSCEQVSIGWDNLGTIGDSIRNVMGSPAAVNVTTQTSGDGFTYTYDEGEWDQSWYDDDGYYQYEDHGRHHRQHYFLKTVGVFVRTFFAGLVGFAVAVLFPNHLAQVKSTVQEKTVVSGVVGGLTGAAMAVVNMISIPILLLLTLLCGLGVILGLGLLVVQLAGIALGWATMGALVGDKLVHWFKLNTRSLPLITAVGTAVLTFTLGVLGLIPFVIGEGVLAIIIAWIGLGAVALTKLGTRPYPPYLSDEIRIITPDPDKVSSVLDTLPDEDNPFKS